MNFTIEIEQEEDGRFLAEVIAFPGVLAYGQTREEAVARVQALALRVLEETNLSSGIRAQRRMLEFCKVIFEDL